MTALEVSSKKPRTGIERMHPSIRLLLLSAWLTTTVLAGTALAETGVTKDEIIIGAYDGLTGPIPLTGAQMQTGWQTAVAEINAAGGINGRRLKLLIEDDQYEPSRALAGVRKLLERDNAFLMTGLGTPTTTVVARYLDRVGVPLLFPMGASASQLNQAGLKTLFMAQPAYSSQAEAVIGWMVDHAGVKVPCQINQVDPAGEDHSLGYRRAAEKRGLPVIIEGTERGTMDFSAAVLKAKSAGCDMIYTGMPLESSARVVTAADRLGWHPKFVGFTSQADASLIKLLGPLSEGFHAAEITLPPDSGNPAMAEYLTELKKYHPDTPPTFFVTYAYGAMKLIAKAIRETPEPLTRKGVIATLEGWKSIDGGLLGPVSYSATDHDGKKSLYLIEVKDGHWQKVSDWITPDAASTAKTAP